MTKTIEALRMLNLAFESHDGVPVRQAIITAADYRLLFEALMESRRPEEYICKCGVRVVPHRCQQETEF